MRNLTWDKDYGAHKSTKQASYGRLRMGKSFMQSLTLKHFLAVNVFSKSAAF